MGHLLWIHAGFIPLGKDNEPGALGWSGVMCVAAVECTRAFDGVHVGAELALTSRLPRNVWTRVSQRLLWDVGAPIW